MSLLFNTKSTLFDLIEILYRLKEIISPLVPSMISGGFYRSLDKPGQKALKEENQFSQLDDVCAKITVILYEDSTNSLGKYVPSISEIGFLLKAKTCHSKYKSDPLLKIGDILLDLLNQVSDNPNFPNRSNVMQRLRVEISKWFGAGPEPPKGLSRFIRKKQRKLTDDQKELISNKNLGRFFNIGTSNSDLQIWKELFDDLIMERNYIIIIGIGSNNKVAERNEKNNTQESIKVENSLFRSLEKYNFKPSLDQDLKDQDLKDEDKIIKTLVKELDQELDKLAIFYYAGHGTYKTTILKDIISNSNGLALFDCLNYSKEFSELDKNNTRTFFNGNLSYLKERLKLGEIKKYSNNKITIKSIPLSIIQSNQDKFKTNDSLERDQVFKKLTWFSNLSISEEKKISKKYWINKALDNPKIYSSIHLSFMVLVLILAEVYIFSLVIDNNILLGMIGITLTLTLCLIYYLSGAFEKFNRFVTRRYFMKNKISRLIDERKVKSSYCYCLDDIIFEDSNTLIFRDKREYLNYKTVILFKAKNILMVGVGLMLNYHSQISKLDSKSTLILRNKNVSRVFKSLFPKLNIEILK